MPLLPGAWQTFALLFGILVLWSLLSPIQPLGPFLPWIMLVLVIWVLKRKRVIHRGSADIPTAPGEKVLLQRSMLKFYVAETRWHRRGGGSGVHFGRRVGRRNYLGFSAWSNDSTSTKEEFMRKYFGGAMLTDRRLFLVDGISMTTRLVIPIAKITSITQAGWKRNGVTLSWGSPSPQTIKIEFDSRNKQEAVESTNEWFNLLRELTSGETQSRSSPHLTRVVAPTLPT